ncbi:MAG: RNA degradosome polyphosphate kinase, partial [Synechococcus sp.]|nr:RNA degradosome polyphosphate kinase [Synechococcus sp.]
ELIVRGVCSLRPGLAGHSESISVVSVIGRFLEHSRVFWFGNGSAAEVFIGSADWMSRNLDRRVEAVTPVEDLQLRERLEQLMRTYLNDNRDAWDMDSNGQFLQRRPEGKELQSQLELMHSWRSVQGQGL